MELWNEGKSAEAEKILKTALDANIARVSSAMGDKVRARWAAQAAIAVIEAGEENAFAKRLREEVQKYLN